jgi:hypothetical protein
MACDGRRGAPCTPRLATPALEVARGADFLLKVEAIDGLSPCRCTPPQPDRRRLQEKGVKRE